MSLAQQLLVRALVAWFWRQPYEEKPIRWGTRLHDRFLLPYFVQQDFSYVIKDLNRAGYPIDAAWFAPQWEFRFPAFGQVCYEGVDIELRQAIEPWYTLGEEPGAGGTTRYVDSSLERIQVRATGLISERFAWPATAGDCRFSPPALMATWCAACVSAPGSRLIACILPFPCTPL